MVPEKVGPPAMLTIPEAAARLRIGKSSMYAVLHGDDPPRVVRIGRSVRIPAAALDDWIERHTVAGA